MMMRHSVRCPSISSARGCRARGLGSLCATFHSVRTRTRFVNNSPPASDLHDDATLRPLSQYFFGAGLSGSRVGVAVRHLPLSAYSDQVRQQLPARLINGGVGSEWSMVYAF